MGDLVRVERRMNLARLWLRLTESASVKGVALVQLELVLFEQAPVTITR